MTKPHTQPHRLRLLPAHAVESLTELAELAIVQAVHGGYPADEIPGSVAVEAPQQGDSKAYEVRITYKCSEPDGAMLRRLDLLKGIRLLAVYDDADEEPVMAGTLDCPLRLTYTVTDAVAEVTLSGRTKRPPLRMVLL